ncbi:MAG: GtrA family protein [Lachnospiraceae bacterium]|nr:GtrA family protein [Lachnospiraceae bacterium]
MNMKKIEELINKETIMYLVFGVLTTVVNFVSYCILAYISIFPKSINTVVNTWIAWLISVVFAYLTNRKWVFESKATGIKAIIKEIVAFFACRIATGAMDAVIMFVFVDKIYLNDKIIKLASNVLVVILNYVGSKLFVFKKGKE